MINIIDDDYFLNDNFDTIYVNNLLKNNFGKHMNTSMNTHINTSMNTSMNTHINTSMNTHMNTSMNTLMNKNINKNINKNMSIISKNKLGSLSFTKNLCDLEYSNNKRQNEFYDNNYVIENKKYKN
jgi:hypothetical protein